jgi:hypothetical protein
MTDDKLIDAYHEAMGDYEAAKAGGGNRVETFTRFLVAERVLAARFTAAAPGGDAPGKKGGDARFDQGSGRPWPSLSCL